TVAIAPALAASTLCAVVPRTRSSPTGRTRVAALMAGAFVFFTTNSMALSPQDKESGLQDNAGLVFRWFVCSPSEKNLHQAFSSGCHGRAGCVAASLSVAPGA